MPRSMCGFGLTFAEVFSFCVVEGCEMVRKGGSRTNEMHRTQDSYESVSCNCRAECSLESSAFAWGVGDLGGRSAAL